MEKKERKDDYFHCRIGDCVNTAHSNGSADNQEYQRYKDNVRHFKGNVECWIKEKIMFQSGMLFAEVLTILVKILIIESVSENKNPHLTSIILQKSGKKNLLFYKQVQVYLCDFLL